MPIDKDKLYLMEPVLAWLDKGARHHEGKGVGFNMDYFLMTSNYSGFNKDFKGKNCGTVCCIAGAVVQFNKLDDNELDGTNYVGDLLGMTEREEDQLFFASNYDNGNIDDKELSEITAKEAATTLRRFIETGEIIWDNAVKYD